VELKPTQIIVIINNFKPILKLLLLKVNLICVATIAQAQISRTRC